MVKVRMIQELDPRGQDGLNVDLKFVGKLYNLLAAGLRHLDLLHNVHNGTFDGDNPLIQ